MGVLFVIVRQGSFHSANQNLWETKLFDVFGMQDHENLMCVYVCVCVYTCVCSVVVFRTHLCTKQKTQSVQLWTDTRSSWNTTAKGQSHLEQVSWFKPKIRCDEVCMVQVPSAQCNTRLRPKNPLVRCRPNTQGSGHKRLTEGNVVEEGQVLTASCWGW